jgi:hypothetical protein
MDGVVDLATEAIHQVHGLHRVRLVVEPDGQVCEMYRVCLYVIVQSGKYDVTLSLLPAEYIFGLEKRLI